MRDIVERIIFKVKLFYLNREEFQILSWVRKRNKELPMIIPDKQIHNNFKQYESVFLQYSSMERIYTEAIPYHEFKNSPYQAFYVLEGAMSLKITGADGEEKISAVVKHGSFYTQSSKQCYQVHLVAL